MSRTEQRHEAALICYNLYFGIIYLRLFCTIFC